MADNNALGGHYTDLHTLLGLTKGVTDLGTFTGATISDNDDIKGALQALETALEATNTIYTGDGTLSSARTITLNSNSLTFDGSGTTDFSIASDGESTARYVNYGGTVPSTIEEGMTWFDSNTQQIYLSINVCAASCSWALGNDTVTGRCFLAGAGTQTAGLNFGGANSGSTVVACTEEFDGATWSAGGNMLLARCELAGTGTQTAGLNFQGSCGGARCVCTEEYNGTSWSAGGNHSRIGVGTHGTGAQTATFGAGGFNGAYNCDSYEYNGTSWSACANMAVSRTAGGAIGTTSAAAILQGQCAASTPTTCTEDWNGTSFSGGDNSLTGRWYVKGAGTTTDALNFAGLCSASCACTEYYDGTAWATDVSMITAVRCPARGGYSQNRAALSSGGYDTAVTDATELYLYSANGNASQGVWSTTDAITTARRATGATGTQEAGLSFGGINAADCTCTEEYDGATWSAGGALGTALRGTTVSAGTQTAAISAGIYCSGVSYTCTQEYNGTSWSAGTAYSATRSFGEGAGTQTAALGVGGVVSFSPNVVCCDTYEWNDVSWSSGGNLPENKWGGASNGTQTAALVTSGDDNVVGQTNSTFLYNGSTWDTINPNIVAIREAQGFGESSSFTRFGGDCGGSVTTTCTEEYNGFAWYSANSLNQAIRNVNHGIGSTGSQGLYGGGQCASTCTCSEEYTYVNYSATEAVWTTTSAYPISVDLLAGFGTQTAMIGAGGYPGSGNGCACVYSYNGASWTTESSVNGIRNLPGAGTLTAGIIFGGYDGAWETCSCEYDGSSWSAGGALNTEAVNHGGAGSQTAALRIAGSVTGGGFTTCTEEYNGTSWSTSGATNVASSETAGLGLQTDAKKVGNNCISCEECVEDYNGTSWSSGTPRIVSAYAPGAAGLTTSGLAWGGKDGAASFCSCTEYWNDVSWSTVNPRITGISHPAFGPMGTASCALTFAGICAGTTRISCAEEYTCVDVIGFRLCYI